MTRCQHVSVEIRKTADGRKLECDWGVFENGEADPRRVCGLQPLMLTTAGYMRRLLIDGPEPGLRGGVASAARQGDRWFAHLDHEGNRTTWELFDAHFWDGEGPHDILIGRWPD